VVQKKKELKNLELVKECVLMEKIVIVFMMVMDSELVEEQKKENLEHPNLEHPNLEQENLKQENLAVKKPNSWIMHVKKYAKMKGLTYQEALQSPGVKKGYKKKNA